MGFKKSSTGRNEPCPCGSGVKYKKCCLRRDSDSQNKAPLPGIPGKAEGQSVFSMSDNPSPSHTAGRVRPQGRTSSGVSNELREAMAGIKFESIEQAQAFANQFMNERNSSPVSEFHGITPEQMHRMVARPFDSLQLITLHEDYQVNSDVPFVMFFEALLAAVGNKNFQPTAKGNFSRAFSRARALQYWGEESYERHMRLGGINSEEDFKPLNAFRHTCEFAGCLRKYNGKFIISSNHQALMKTGGISAIYRNLFRNFVLEFNWAAYDRYPDVSHMQHNWVFSLYLLQQYGDQWRPSSFYEDAFLNAFPSIVDKAADSPYMTSAQQVKGAYRIRVVEQWMTWFGLAEVIDDDEDDYSSTSLQVRKTALADKVLSINL